MPADAPVLRALSDEKEGKRVKGALTALVADRSPLVGIGPAEGYHPAGYLDQHARRTRRFDVPHAGFWDAAARHTHLPDDLARLGHVAERRWRKRHAAQLYRRATDAGNTFALAQVVAAAAIRLGARRLAVGSVVGAASWKTAVSGMIVDQNCV